MQIETEERKPRPRHFKIRISHVEAVFPLLNSGKSRQEISRATGLKGDTLTYAIRDNYAAGYVLRPDPEIQRNSHRINTSIARGGVFAAIEDYIPLDLTAKQTKIAVAVNKGIALEQSQVAHAYSREMHRHGLQRPIKELMVEAQRDKFRSPEELLNIVRNRQAAYRLTIELGLEKPKTLRQWNELEKDPRRELTEEEFNKLAELLLNRIFVPRDTLAQRYLLNLANGSANLNVEIEQIDPTLKQRLSVKASLIIRQTGRSPH